MKVLFVYKYLTVGGVETVLQARLHGLAQHGWEGHAWFLLDGPGRSLFADLPDQVHVGDLHALERHLQKHTYALISSIDTEEVLQPYAKLSAPPGLLMEVHTPYPENLEYLRGLSGAPIHAYLVPSAFQAQVARARLGTDVDLRVVPNPLAPAFAAPLHPFQPAPPRPVVAWLGRLDAVKNWREFVDMAGVLKSQASHVDFWLMGCAPERDAAKGLYDHARQARILERMRWFRQVAHTHVPRFLDAVRQSGGVLVSTSRGESFGMTLAEAMARGCAVVAPDSGPFAEFMQPEEHGLVYALGDPAQAAKQVHRLLREHAFRDACGHRGRTHILARHGPQQALAALVQTLESFVCVTHT